MSKTLEADITKHLILFMSVENARFKRPVVPGDQLIFDVTFDKRKRDLWKFRARASVDGELACTADMMCVLKQTLRTTGED